MKQRLGVLIAVSTLGVAILAGCGQARPQREASRPLAPTVLTATSDTSSPDAQLPWDEESPSPQDDQPSPTPSDTATPDKTNTLPHWDDFCLRNVQNGLAYFTKQSDHTYILLYARQLPRNNHDYQDVDNGIQFQTPVFPHWIELPSQAGPDDDAIRIQTARDWRSPSHYFDANAPRAITPDLSADQRLGEKDGYDQLVNTLNTHWRSILSRRC